MSLTEDQHFAAVEARDVSADTLFVYAVRSTGIYCRPSCPARRPARHHIAFFDAPDAAEAAGFRACLRCRPRETAAHAEAVRAACLFIDTHAGEPLPLATLSAQVGLSPQHFQRIFRRSVGITPREYIDTRRLQGFKQALHGEAPITKALIDAGYGSTSRLYEQAPAQMGMTPTQYRQGGRAQTLIYATAPTPLGTLLVASTTQGICAITLGDTEAALVDALRHEYPAADMTRDDTALADAVQQIVRHLEGHLPDLRLPLDVRATAFQRRVWQALQAVPRGETRSYAQVAAAIGQPSAIRAVARACAQNPTALAVPCHRVVRTGGALSGYRWGVERKQALLEREQADIPPA